MNLSVLKLIAIVMFVVSVCLAVITHMVGNALLWAVWSFAVLAVFAGVIP